MDVDMGVTDGIADYCCIGAGRLGVFSTIALARQHPDKNFHVVDEDQELIEKWQEGDNDDTLPFREPQLAAEITALRDENLFFSDDVVGTIQECEVIFLAIETWSKPYGTGEKGSRMVLDKWRKMVLLIKEHASEDKYIIDKSTVPVDDRNLIVDLLAPHPNVPNGINHAIFSNPEFFSQGTSFATLLDPPRVVVYGPKSNQADPVILDELYAHIPAANRIVIGRNDFRAGEFAKIFNNALLGCMAILANTGSSLADRLDLDIHDSLDVIRRDNRLGADFLSPDVAVGGPSLQRDISYLAYIADEFNMKEVALLFKTFMEVNKKRKELFVKKMLDIMASLKDQNIVILGFAFKAGTEDVSNSPALHMCEMLLKKERANLRIYDEFVSEETVRDCLKANGGMWANQNRLRIADGLNDELWEGAHAICVLTRDAAFENIDFNHILPLMNEPAYFFDFTGNPNFDLQQINDEGFKAAYSIGRPIVKA